MSYAKLKGDTTRAKRVRFTAAAAVSDGDVVDVGDRIGVAYNDTANGAEGIAIVATDEKGILMPNAATAKTRGSKAYWDAVNGNVVAAVTAAAEPFIGYFAEAATAADTEVVVELVDAQG